MLYNRSAIKNRIPVTKTQIAIARQSPILRSEKALETFIDNVFKRKPNALETVLATTEKLAGFIHYNYNHRFEGIRTAKQAILHMKGNCLEQASALYVILKHLGIPTKFVVMKNPKGFKIKLSDEGVHAFLRFEYKGKKYLADQVSRGVYLPENFWYAAKQEMSIREFNSFCFQIGGEDVLRSHRKPKEALVYFSASLKMNPNNYCAYVYSADSYVDLRNYDEARKNIRTATRMTPGLADPYKIWGDTLRLDGKIDEAMEAYEKAAERDSSDYQVLYSLEFTLNRLGRKKARDKVYEKRNRLGETKPDINKEPCLLRMNHGKIDRI